MGKRIAIITARGGSKRIPKKNIKDFCGKPIIAYSIEAAISSKLFDEVMVSTDSEEIAEIAKKYGASVPFMRSAETSNDYATTNDVLIEVFNEYEKRGQEFDIAVCIYPTAPFVTADKLKRAIDMVEKDGADAVTPVVQFRFHHSGHLSFGIMRWNISIRKMPVFVRRILKQYIMTADSFMLCDLIIFYMMLRAQ